MSFKSWNGGNVWTDLGVLSLLVGSLISFLYQKKIANKLPFQVVWSLDNYSLDQHLVNFLLC